MDTRIHPIGGTHNTSFKLTFTPYQRFISRGLLDPEKTLGTSWINDAERKTVYVVDDFGLQSVKDGKIDAQRQRFDGFDLGMIPIVAYGPRRFMLIICCAPQDNVRIFKGIRAKKSITMHWGCRALILTKEEAIETPTKLAEECKKIGIDEGDFLVSDVCETKYF
ncbi:hypothetical protein ARMGADRAFT_1168131 [Armillaria gallica]|uniref:Metallo-beta-lactamase domain-containing protein n=1 Tax=Armillaria gallica TaxID=47427 RepID=A0A2H3D2A5_ARMGA|nr:hypothetical protein ARMGADRAFT_1168131 [Armillaria gallica]